MEGSGRGLIFLKKTFLEFAWKGGGKPRKPQAGLLANRGPP